MAYTRWVSPFSAAEAEAYYADMVAFALFVGIPAPLLPPDRPAFNAYLDGVLDSGLLGGGGQGRALVAHILWFEHRSVPSPIVRIGRVLAVDHPRSPAPAIPRSRARRRRRALRATVSTR